MSGVQFVLKSYALFQNRTSAQRSPGSITERVSPVVILVVLQDFEARIVINNKVFESSFTLPPALFATT